jgi:hypothetical protein
MQVNAAMNLGLVPKIITVSPELKLLDSNIGAQKQERGAVRILPVFCSSRMEAQLREIRNPKL